jgi:hypothetical protein
MNTIMNLFPSHSSQKMCFNTLLFIYSYYKNYKPIHEWERELCDTFVCRYDACIKALTNESINDCLDTLREIRDECHEKYAAYKKQHTMVMRPFRVIYDGVVIGLESTRRPTKSYEFEDHIEWCD